ncbi:hypothetical protein [Saccharopolyspora spinosa]|uniref:Uncharacterized protein n=1 Tax=Saccharopolyspora spinosa TaxID=60894 RepID=A0A2N3XYX8_SACSN|nr:hypothetical protein [Saccharopolyspora spinosa]PKW15821.1 hypothetical protein A8926_3591 [Saccharopolyspora spinosa]
MTTTQAWLHYFWRPVPDDTSSYGLVRHAFFGTSEDAAPSVISACDEIFALAKPSEIDWIHAPTCSRCNEALEEMKVQSPTTTTHSCGDCKEEGCRKCCCTESTTIVGL